MINKQHSILRFTKRALAGSAVILTTLLFGGCTHSQQDYLLTEVVSMGRDSAGLEVKSAPAGDVKLTYMERQGAENKKNETIILLIIR